MLALYFRTYLYSAQVFQDIKSASQHGSGNKTKKQDLFLIGTQDLIEKRQKKKKIWEKVCLENGKHLITFKKIY